MCLLKVKEEPDLSVPARVREVRRVRGYSTSPPRSARYSSTRIIEERRPSGYNMTQPDPSPLPPPASSVYADLPPAPPAPPPAPGASYSSTRIEAKRSSRAPSVQSRTRSHYVEVEHESDSSSSSSSSSSDGLRSRTTKPHRTSNTHKSSKSQTAAPSEYSEHEREIRRERRYSKPRGEYETYRYVNAPPDYGRSSSRRVDYGDPRASQSSYRERERVVMDDEFGRRRREYRP